MVDTTNTDATATAHEAIDRISVTQCAGIWRVSLNRDFFGDYVRRYWALEAAFEKADDIAARGGAAIITWTVDGQQDAPLYDPRRPTPRGKAERAVEARATRARRWPPPVGEGFARRLLEQAKG